MANINTATTETVQVPDINLNETLVKLALLKAQASALKERTKAVEAELKTAMEEAGEEHIEAAGHIVHYTTCKRTSFDNKAYAQVHPRVAARYMKESTSRRFTIN